MSNDAEYSESDSPILRHQPRETDWEPAVGSGEAIEAISAHIEKYVGKIDMVYHEIVSDLVHLDIHMVYPTPER
ncbi:MAG: suppressor of fused domain protein, partial [Alphaproteobacteria bacterium]